MFSVVYVLAPTVEDPAALFTVIGYVDTVSKFGSFSLRIDGVAFCPTETTGLIPTIHLLLVKSAINLNNRLI